MKRSTLSKTLIFTFATAILSFVLYIWWQGSSSLFTEGKENVFIALGRLLGLLGMLFILTQLVLIGRISLIENLWGHDRMNKVHRLVGYFILILFLGHPLLLITGYSMLNDTNAVAQTVDFATNWEDVFNAILGVILFTIIIILSLPFVRKKLKYENWYFTHLFMYMGIILVFGHQKEEGDIAMSDLYETFWNALVYGIVALMIIHRFLRPIYRLYKHRFKVEKIVRENSTVNSIYVTGERMGSFRHIAGQFAHIRIFAKKFWKESHPFSISIAPNGRYLRFTPKMVGDFTNKIPEVPVGSYVLIDGPLGHFTKSSSKREKFLFIAGGIGITPIRAMIEDFSRENIDMILLWAVTDESDLVFMNELSRMIKNIHIFVSNGSKNPAFQNGRITLEKIREYSPDFLDRDIFLCGPPKMMESVRELLHTLEVPRSQIHFEKFSY